MAEDCTKAFGRYLRTLRERRGLSLDDVCSLSQTFPEKLTKGYLSRCENGRQKLAFAKVIPLSRIYEVPADALIERMELDMELDRVGGPEVGADFRAESFRAKELLEEGVTWHAYGIFRDISQIASSAPVGPSFRDTEEQVAVAHMNCASAARALGRYRFALHEYKAARRTPLGPVFSALVVERIATCYRSLDRLESALAASTESVQLHEQLGDHRFLGHAYATHAMALYEKGAVKAAAGYFKKSYETHKFAGQDSVCPPMLNSLAQCYFDLGHFRAARRTVQAAATLAERHGSTRSRALSLILLGELDELDSRFESANRKWQNAIAIAKTIHNRTIRFKAEYLMFRRAVRDNNHPTARAIRRRLRRLANAIPVDTAELKLFRQLDQDKALLDVAGKQPESSRQRNGEGVRPLPGERLKS